MQMAAPILVAGAINTDLVAHVARAPTAGETVTGSVFAIHGGGKGANQAVAVARSGGTAYLVGAIGADDFGRDRLTELGASGVSTRWVMVSGDAPSGVALITVEAGGENRIAYVPGATSTVPSSHVTDALDAIEPGFVLATNELPHDALHGLFSRATAAGARVIFNATPDPATAVDLLANVSILVVNAGEAAALLGSGAIGDPRDAVLSLRDRGPETVILTAGPDGACAGFPGGVEWHRPPEVQVVDTTGAGDTFCGAFAAILANGGHISEAARFGVHASALSVTRHGAQSSIPARTEIDASLARHP